METTKIIGKVTEEEKNEIMKLFEQKSALKSLAITLAENKIPPDNRLHERLIKDLGEVEVKYQNWWDRMAKKYAWEGSEWNINFNTCEIFLN